MKNRTTSRTKTIVIWCMAVGILVPGGYGFAEKLRQFILTLGTAKGGGFTIFPIANYFIIALGMACLLIWAILNGMFRNVEGPKFDMLDREAKLDQQEGRPWEVSKP